MIQIPVSIPPTLQTFNRPIPTPVFAETSAANSNNNQGLSVQLRPPRRKVCLKTPPASHVIFTKFFSFSDLGTRYAGGSEGRKRFVIYERRKFNPLQATIQEVVDFFFYLELTEVMTLEHQKACITSLSKYLPHLEQEMKVESFKDVLSDCSPSFSVSKDHLDKLMTLSNYLSSPDSIKTWNKFSEFCIKNNQDPFIATPEIVVMFIQHVLFSQPGRTDYDLLLSGYKFYTKNIETICGRLEKMMCGYVDQAASLLQHDHIQNLMRTAVAMENKILSNDLALSLLPKHHYVRVRLNRDEENFWNGSFMLKVFYDVKNNLISLSVAALEVGVTTEMLFSGMMVKSRRSGETLPSLSEFLQQRNGRERKYWTNPRVAHMLEDVRIRLLPVHSVAAQLGVSRNRILQVCGKIKTQEEIDAEKALEAIKKINERDEAVTNYRRATQLQKQIWMAEEEEENLCAYEQQRLANLRERMEMLAELDIEDDKKAIWKQTRIISSSTSKKVVVEPREKSARIKRIQEQRRFQTSTERVQLGQKNRTSPHWFGKTVPTPSSEEKVIANNPVPKFDLLATQLLEITTDYRASSVFLQSLSEEGEDQPQEGSLQSDIDWARGLTKTGESIVSTSPVTGLDTWADLLCYGTGDGGVGVLLEGRSVTIRPHHQAVTDVLFRAGTGGLGVMSSSLDGTVRLYDLVSQQVALEYSWDSTALTPHSVLGMAKTGEDTFLLDVGTEVLTVDLRTRKPSLLFKVEESFVPEERTSFEVHPTDKKLLSICRGNRANTVDVRSPGETVWSISGQVGDHVMFGGWSHNTGQYYCYVTEARCDPFVLDVTNRLPTLIQRDGTFKAKPRIPGRYEWMLMAGSVWCPWEETSIFSVFNKELQLVDCLRYRISGTHIL